MARYLTRFGIVRRDEGCKSNYWNIVEQDRDGYTLKLQRSAMRSFRRAEKSIGREIRLTGSWRDCAYQAALYAKDPNRYASPNATLHTHGLAIDVSTTLKDQEEIRKALLERKWKQSRPDDEPWHYSFYLKA
jgi:hypothetical protein